VVRVSVGHMRILHTSDWHIGRTFHGHSTVESLRVVLAALVDEVRQRAVDVVVVSGDIFDSATPAADFYTVLTSSLRQLREAGATVILTSGNHDSATRLGFQSEFAQLAGIHVITRHDQLDTPVTISDEHGPVHFYGIPYLEPSLVRHHYPEAKLTTHEQVLGFAMGRVRADLADRDGRSVVLSHCFAVGVESSDVERDITSGGIDYVPAGVFDGPDYVALGHIHSRTTISERVRYSGAPLHYSFGEAARPRGAWLVQLDAAGLGEVTWVDLPIPRRLAVLAGTIEELLTDARHDAHADAWVSAVLTDQMRPLDGMRRLQQRFPHCVNVQHHPLVTADAGDDSYAERVRGKSDNEIVADFLTFVRNGSGPSEYERETIREAIAVQAASDDLEEAVA